MHDGAKRIRNVALVGHRGSGKTSLNEALLFEAGAVNRLGSVADGTTVSDSAPDEKAREMSIASSLTSFRWDDRKINLVDTPGEPSFVADALAALRVCEGAVFVVNGVMGVEVGTDRLWRRAEDLGLSRLIFVNMLDRERADFFRALESLKAAFGQHVVATEIPIGSEHELQGVIDLVDMKAFRYDGAGRDSAEEIEIPEDLRPQAEEYREKLMDEVAEVSDELMERYLEGEEISHEETVGALKSGVTGRHDLPGDLRRGHPQPGHQQAAGRARRGPALTGAQGPRPGGRRDAGAHGGRRHGGVRLQDPGRPVRRPHQPLPRLPGRGQARLARHELPRARQGAHRPAPGPAGQGARARRRVRPRRHRRGGQAQGDPRRRRAVLHRQGDRPAHARPAAARDGLRHGAQGQGRRGEGVHRPAAPPGGGPHHRRAPRRPDRRGDRGRPDPGARGGDRGPDARALRGGGHAQAAAGALPRDDPSARPRRTGATRSRPGAGASSATATSRSSRFRTVAASSS